MLLMDIRTVLKLRCCVDECERPYKCRGFCKFHYNRWRQQGDPALAKLNRPERPRPKCKFDGCTGFHEAKGYCRTHYTRLRRTGSLTLRQPLTMKDPERVLSHILGKTTKTENGCLEYTGKHGHYGYGRVHVDGKERGAHRVMACIKGNAPLDTSLFALHSCDNPPCVNPDHLRLGTPTDNVRDMFARNRIALGSERRNAKLTEEEVVYIRESPAPAKVIAIMFHMSESAVYLIRSGKLWKHVA